MNSLTGDFDYALQIRADLVERVFQTMYATGRLCHYVVRSVGNKQIELQIGAPHLDLPVEASGTAHVQAVVSVRVLYRSRDEQDSFVVGTLAVVEMRVQAKLSLQPADRSGSEFVMLTFDWSDTTADDISLQHLVGPEPAAVVIAQLLQLVQAIHGTMSLPLSGLDGQTATSKAVLHVLPAHGIANAPALVNLGLAVAATAPPAPRPGTCFVTQAWALAFAGPYLLDKIWAQLRQQWQGHLPPPHGPSGVVIQEYQNSGLFGDYTVRIMLQSLDALFEQDSLRFSGRLTRIADSIVVPDISAEFTAHLRLTITANGQLEPEIHQDDVEVSITDWYAELLDLFISGDLGTLLREALRQALSDYSRFAVQGLLAPDMLARLTAMGRATGLSLKPSLAQVVINANGIVIQGDLAMDEAPLWPHAQFSVLPRSGTNRRRLLHAGKSWAPQTTLSRYIWNINGTDTLSYTSNDACFVTDYTFSPGTQRVQLTVIDHHKRTATMTQEFGVAALTLSEGEHNSWALPSNEPPISTYFTVLDNDTCVADATVVVTGREDYVVQHTTASDGRAWFALDPSRFIELPAKLAPYGHQSYAAYAIVTASAHDYASTRRHLMYSPRPPWGRDWVTLQERLLDFLTWPLEVLLSYPDEQVLPVQARRILDDVCRLMRELGEQFLAITQQPSPPSTTQRKQLESVYVLAQGQLKQSQQAFAKTLTLSQF